MLKVRSRMSPRGWSWVGTGPAGPRLGSGSGAPGTRYCNKHSSSAPRDAVGRRDFHIALAAGHYMMICNLPGRYLAGMHAAFTVTGTS